MYIPIKMQFEKQIKYILIYIKKLQEHPSLRGTPLAMLAAQCNKLSNKSPPPLADAAVGKGFHPWKKSPTSLGQHSPPNVGNTITQRNNLTSTPTSSMGNFTTR